jgi:adenylate cyclase
LVSLDHAVESGFYRLSGPSEPRDDVVVIAVDDETLDRIQDPLVFWGPHFAAAVARLRLLGATAIGIDFLLEQSAEGWFARNGLQDLALSRNLDASLRAQLYQGGVVLAASFEVAPDGTVVHQLPNRDYLAVLDRISTQVALTDLPLDSDQVVRRFRPVIFDVQDRPGLSMALALVLRHLNLDATPGPWQIGGRSVAWDSDRIELAFVGPGGTIPTIPLHRLLAEGPLTPAEEAAIDGAIALIGPTYSSSSDWFVTPLTPTASQGMRGVEVHATAVTTLLSGRRLLRLGPRGRLALYLCTSALLGMVLFRSWTRTGVLAFVAHTALWPVVGWIAFVSADLLLPVGSAVVVGFGVFAGAVAVRYADEQRKRRFLSSLFGRYVSERLLQVLLDDPDALGLGGVRREVSILFADMKGFTTLSERLSPEEVVEMLNAFFGQACRPILAHGGEINTYLGDAVMAVWGAPLDDPDHARNAMKAALEVAQEALRFQSWMDERFAGRGLPAFDIGIGVHSGPAVSGNVGIEERIEYSVIGDTVNTASRIEGLTRVTGCRILVSSQALAAAGPGVRTGLRAELPVKGKSEPVVVVELLGLVDP